MLVKSQVLTGRERALLRRRILLLTVLPVLDATTNQINTAYHITIGSFSMLQVFRGTLLGMLLCMVGLTPRPGRHCQSAIGGVVLWLLLCLSLVATNQAVNGHGIVLLDLITYVQIGYWITVWYATHIWIRDVPSARMVLHGLMGGGLVTAASVYYGYIVGVSNPIYALEGVRASSGFFVSGKGIAGTLVVGGVTAGYLGIGRRTWSYSCAAVICFGACFLTYARAGLVALWLSLLWLVIWSTMIRSGRKSSWVGRVMTVTTVSAAILVATVGTADLNRRWSDVNNPNRAGSGRLHIWAAAAESFGEADLSEQLAGRGFQGMLEFIGSRIGNRIHTHNDMLDMLVTGGVIGVVFLLLVFAALLAQILRTPVRSPEFAVAFSILLALSSQAIFTGQLFMPDVMSYYVVGITALTVNSQPAVSKRQAFRIVPAYQWYGK